MYSQRETNPEGGINEGDGQVGDVDANPAAAEFFGGSDGGAAAAEGIEDDIAGIAAGLDDAFEQSREVFELGNQGVLACPLIGLISVQISVTRLTFNFIKVYLFRFGMFSWH